MKIETTYTFVLAVFCNSIINNCTERYVLLTSTYHEVLIV